jgi:glycosyltransferase 2 family protein
VRKAGVPHGLKRYLHWAGSALAAVGIIFVAIRLRDYSGQIDLKDFGRELWWVVGGCALVYGLSNAMLALAWWNLLRQFGTDPSRRWAIRTYGISQLAKYVPGNIFHLAGRQAIGMAAGVPGWSLAKSSIWELGLIALAGSLFGLLALPLVFASLPLQLGVSGFVLAVMIVAAVLRTSFGPAAVWAFGWYVGFLAMSGVLFVSLIGATFPSAVASGANWIVLCGAYVLAWLAGLLTPGAPAGVGVRELVLLFLLKGLVGESELLLAVVLGRVVTVVGDLLFFVIASLQKRNEPIGV